MENKFVIKVVKYNFTRNVFNIPTLWIWLSYMHIKTLCIGFKEVRILCRIKWVKLTTERLSIWETLKRERLGLFGFCVCGAFTWGCIVPLMPEAASGFIECEKVYKRVCFNPIGILDFGHWSKKSCNVKIKQKSSLKQTRVKGVLVVGLQKPSAK